MKLLNTIAAGLIAFVVAVFVNLSPAPPNDEWFRNHVTESERPVLVKFGAEWCGPCRQTDQVIEQARSLLSGRVKIVRIDVDKKPDLAKYYGIHAIPRIFLMSHGKIIARAPGFSDPEQLNQWVRARTKAL